MVFKPLLKRRDRVTMSVFLQMSLVGVGDILWVLRSTLRTHIPCEGGWLRCRSSRSSLLVNEWFRRGVAGSQSFGHRRYFHWKYGRSMWGTSWVPAQDVCGCGLVGWEPLSLTQVDSALPYFLSKDVRSLGRWIAFPTCPPKLLLHQGQPAWSLQKLPLAWCCGEHTLHQNLSVLAAIHSMNQPLKGKSFAVAHRHVLSTSRFPWGCKLGRLSLGVSSPLLENVRLRTVRVQLQRDSARPPTVEYETQFRENLPALLSAGCWSRDERWLASSWSQGT